jgi:hypothetical protein
MNLPTASAEAPARAAAMRSTRVRVGLIERFDDLAMRIADRAPSTRALLIVLGLCALALVSLAMTGGKKPGSSPAFIEATAASHPPLTASAAADSPALSSTAAPATPAREEPTVAITAVAQAPARSDPIAPAASYLSASVVPAGRMEIARTDRAPRVIDVARTEPLSSNAAEILRAEPLGPRVGDAPRPEAPVGATSRAAIESTLSSVPPRNREIAEPARDELPRPALAPERTPSAEPPGASAL